MAAPVPLVQSDTVTVPLKQSKIFMWVDHLVQITSLLTSACFMYATSSQISAKVYYVTVLFISRENPSLLAFCLFCYSCCYCLKWHDLLDYSWHPVQCLDQKVNSKKTNVINFNHMSSNCFKCYI